MVRPAAVVPRHSGAAFLSDRPTVDPAPPPALITDRVFNTPPAKTVGTYSGGLLSFTIGSEPIRGYRSRLLFFG